VHRTKLVGVLAATAATLGCTAAVASAEPQHVTVSQGFAAPPTTSKCGATIGIACYGPTQIETAYGLDPLYADGLDGAGKTIVIVDSFGVPTIQAELTKFDTAYGLPAPPSFQIIQPAGPVKPFKPNSTRIGWAEETSLDVEYAHAVAPGANILLVETPTAETEGPVGLGKIDKAEEYVIDNGLGDVITQSFDATENTFANAGSLDQYRKPYFDAAQHNVTVLAAAGDAGATNETAAPDASDWYPFPTVGFPASDPLVTAVGGTHLLLNDAGNRYAPDTVWNDGEELCTKFGGPCTPASGGGGVSIDFARPAYQDGVAGTVGAMRGIPDVSMSAAVDGGVLVYLDFAGLNPGYYIIGGTSEASPEFAGIVAIADQAAGHDLGDLNPTLYANGGGLTDITAGNNTVSFKNPATDPYPGDHTVTGFDAVPGYDLSSGLGTPDGAATISALSGTTIDIGGS
jgi:subtilase family serine protease